MKACLKIHAKMSLNFVGMATAMAGIGAAERYLKIHSNHTQYQIDIEASGSSHPYSWRIPLQWFFPRPFFSTRSIRDAGPWTTDNGRGHSSIPNEY